MLEHEFKSPAYFLSPLGDENQSILSSLKRPTSVAAAAVPKVTGHCLKRHWEDALEPCFLCRIPQTVDNQVWAKNKDKQKNAFLKACRSLEALA